MIVHANVQAEADAEAARQEAGGLSASAEQARRDAAEAELVCSQLRMEAARVREELGALRVEVSTLQAERVKADEVGGELLVAFVISCLTCTAERLRDSVWRCCFTPQALQAARQQHGDAEGLLQACTAELQLSRSELQQALAAAQEAQAHLSKLQQQQQVWPWYLRCQHVCLTVKCRRVCTAKPYKCPLLPLLCDFFAQELTSTAERHEQQTAAAERGAAAAQQELETAREQAAAARQQLAELTAQVAALRDVAAAAGLGGSAGGYGRSGAASGTPSMQATPASGLGFAPPGMHPAAAGHYGPGLVAMPALEMSGSFMSMGGGVNAFAAQQHLSTVVQLQGEIERLQVSVAQWTGWLWSAPNRLYADRYFVE